MFNPLELKLMRPEMLFILVPALILLLFLIYRSFVKLSLSADQARRRRKLRFWLLFSRSVIIVCIVLALAVPYGEVRSTQSGDPRVLLLVDNSSSMQVFDLGFIEAFKVELERYVPVTVRSLALGEQSAIGDGILQHLEQNANVLIVSDGQNTRGTTLQDVGLFASNLNVTISLMDLTPAAQEASVFIVGPSKTLSDVENTFAVGVSGVLRDRVRLTVQVDEELVIDEDVVLEGEVVYKEFKAQFSEGHHRILARISGSDFFSTNNEAYKVVKVLEKPKVLYVGDARDPILIVLEKLFEVEKATQLPADLASYYAVIINDQPAEKFRDVSGLSDFLIDEGGRYYGNGLVVIGGFDSFERGGYKNSALESLLPVRVGTAQKTKGNQNLMFVIDVSGGVQNVRYVPDGSGGVSEVRDAVAPVEMIKNRVVEVLEVLDPTHRVGANAFGISTVGKSYESANQAIAASVERLEPALGEPMSKYFDVKNNLIDKVVSIQGGGNSFPDVAYRDAVNLLARTSGDKRIILLTDGRFQGQTREQLSQFAASSKQMGIQTFVIGVGRDDANLDGEYLRDRIAAPGGGVYVPSKEINKVKILFGDPENKKFGDDFTLFYLSLGHFITRDMDALEVYPVLNGWNQVVPKAASQLLVTTDAGDPALSVWRYGNGRVAALTVFRGDSLGPLLQRNTSIFLTRIVNWAVGDPERKAEYFVEVPDAEMGVPSKISIKTDKLPTSQYLDFTKDGPDLYSAEFVSERQGFSDILGVPFATNYVKEYQVIGASPELRSLSELTWSTVSVEDASAAGVLCSRPFKPSEVEDVVSCAKTASRRVIVERTSVVWPLLVLALLVYLVELVVRRRYERRR
ncbi:MAG: VWA domain-containing protein [Nitrosarchaeum sp.]|nr:VWA domain-containing protein [Nitrosarchaeum sp.]